MEDYDDDPIIRNMILMQKYLKRNEDGFCIMELVDDAPEWCEEALEDVKKIKDMGYKM